MSAKVSIYFEKGNDIMIIDLRELKRSLITKVLAPNRDG